MLLLRFLIYLKASPLPPATLWLLAFAGLLACLLAGLLACCWLLAAGWVAGWLLAGHKDPRLERQYGKWVVKCLSRGTSQGDRAIRQMEGKVTVQGAHYTIHLGGYRKEDTEKRILETGCSRQDAECRIQARLHCRIKLRFAAWWPLASRGRRI